MAIPRAELTCSGANQGKNAAELPSPAAKEVLNPLRDPAPRAATRLLCAQSRCCHTVCAELPGRNRGAARFARGR
jgi:hypothetical protein